MMSSPLLTEINVSQNMWEVAVYKWALFLSLRMLDIKVYRTSYLCGAEFLLRR
jgi:hypothetical protein